VRLHRLLAAKDSAKVTHENQERLLSPHNRSKASLVSVEILNDEGVVEGARRADLVRSP
jgi:hypothetical protein